MQRSLNSNTFTQIQAILKKYNIDLQEKQAPLEILEQLRKKLKSKINSLEEIEDNRKDITQAKRESQEKVNEDLASSLKEKINTILRGNTYNYRQLVEEAIADGNINTANNKQVAFMTKLKLDDKNPTIRHYLDNLKTSINSDGKLEFSFQLDSDGDDDTATIKLDIDKKGIINEQDLIKRFKTIITTLYKDFDINNPKARISGSNLVVDSNG